MLAVTFQSQFARMMSRRSVTDVALQALEPFGGIVGWTNEPGLAVNDSLGDAIHVGDDARQAGGHCLENGQWKPLVN